MLDVEGWAERRREHFVRGVSIKELVRRTGLARNTIRVALRSAEPPMFRAPARLSKLEPFKDEIHRLLSDDSKLSGVRVRELLEPLGFDGGKTIVDDYLREVRPLFLRARTHQRTVYRPGEICQWDLWEPSRPVSVGHGQERRAWVVVACLGYARAGAGALIFSKEAADVLWGMTRCLWSLGGLPELLVWDREGCLHARGGRLDTRGLLTFRTRACEACRTYTRSKPVASFRTVQDGESAHPVSVRLPAHCLAAATAALTTAREDKPPGGLRTVPRG